MTETLGPVVPKSIRRIVVLGTGGTISGRAAASTDNIGYKTGEVGVDELIAGLSVPSGFELAAEQVAQVDSKDMRFDIWQDLARSCRRWLADPDVHGIVITHGTDTLEETACFLQMVLAPAKPIVLTCAMRPASALAPDGPQNVRDALVVAAVEGAMGVTVVCAGVIHGAMDVQKVHTYRLDAFASGDSGPVGYVEEGAVRRVRDWPSARSSAFVPASADVFEAVDRASAMPVVDIVTSHAGARAASIDLLLHEKSPDGRPVLRGLVIAATGNGTLHCEIEAGARRALARGVKVLRATRCAQGRIVSGGDDEFEDAGGMSPVKARIALMLRLLVDER